ncbi:MAG: FHA domain-containing protein [Rhodocyclaceae bacterium]|nr:FHA domain-containing protein [Rhodocyclaceae bacterium]
MAKIVVSLDGQIIEQRVVKEALLVLGRSADCDMVIDDGEVSGRHASITTVVNDHFLEDLSSTNGTLVNGRRITRHLLEHNDLIFIGPYRIKYMNAASVGVGFDRTQIISPLAPRVAPANTQVVAAELDSAAASTRATRARFPKGKLVATTGSSAGAERLIDGLLLPVGREGRALGVINRRPLGCFLTQVSGRALELNGKPLGRDPVQLTDGDEIVVGSDKLIFRTL